MCFSILVSQNVPVPLYVHKKYSHSASNVDSKVNFISSQDDSDFTLRLLPLNNHEEPVLLESWSAQPSPVPKQVSILGSIAYPKHIIVQLYSYVVILVVYS